MGVFGSTNTSSNAFQQAAAGSSSTTSSFGQKINPFGSQQQQQDQTDIKPPTESTNQEKINPFASTKTNIFGSTNSKVDRENQVTGQNDSIIYSLLKNLTQEEIVAFQSDEFTLENIPINPPPKE